MAFPRVLTFWMAATYAASLAMPYSLAPFRYQTLPIGEIRPSGWIRNQLELQAAGLPGHLFDFYRYVQRSLWYGGDFEYSDLHEAGPYWYRATVPLAYLLDDTRLKLQVNQFLDYVIEHQAADGWLGPETEAAQRGIWARLLLLQGMVTHAEADSSREEEIVGAMHRFVSLTHSMLQTDYTGYLPHDGDTFDPYGFGLARAHEYSTSLQWLLEKHPRRQERVIWEVMEMMWEGASYAGFDWRTFFVADTFPKGVSGSKAPKFEHGVNLAEGMQPSPRPSTS
jgi:hypothetical protein